MAKLEDLKKEIELLRSKIRQAEKSGDKNLLPKIRTWRKNMKRAQRKMRFLGGKKGAMPKEKSKEQPAEKAEPLSPPKKEQPAEAAEKK